MDTPPPPVPPPPPAPPPVPLPRIVGHDDNGNFILELETGRYFGQIENGVPHGVGTFTFFNGGNVFRGRWENGQRVEGTTTRRDGKQFKGVWVNDSLYNGFGTASYANGDTFTGEWNEGKPYTGEGIVPYSIGIYEGKFLKGEKHGEGKFTLKDGTIYQGAFLNDKRSGKGEFTTKDIHYIGNWLDGKMNGKGIIVFLADGSSYDGNFENDKRQGYGKHIYKSEGSTYEGEWGNDKKKGKGKIIYKDGSSYKGDWVNDRKHGEGKLTDAKGKITFGLWKFNELSEEYPIFKISEKVLIGCETILGEPYKSDDIIMLHNPPIPTFDITRTFDCVEKCTLNICNFMFTREDIKGLKKLAVDNEVNRLERQGMRIDYAEINKNVIMRNPYNKQVMPIEHLQLCVLSIIPSLPASLPPSLPASLPASLDLFSAEPKETNSTERDESIEGGKRKRKRKRKQTIKRKQKSKRIQIKKKTKRNLH